jgi:hypothetical protein
MNRKSLQNLLDTPVHSLKPVNNSNSMNVLIKSLKNNFGENCQDVEVDQKSKDGMNESGFKDGF